MKAEAASVAETTPGSVTEQAAAKEPLFDEAPALPAQPRLFDPPPQNVQPQSTPSIRPPTIGVVPVNIVPMKLEPQEQAGGADAGVAAPLADAGAEPVAGVEPPAPETVAQTVAEDRAEKPAEVAMPAAEPVAASTATGGEVMAATQAAPKPTPMPAKVATTAVAKAAAKPTNRVIAPQTHDPKRLLAPRPGALARVPLWVILSAVAGVILVLGLVVYVAKGIGKGKTNTTGTEQVRGAQPGPSIGAQRGTPAQPDVGHIYEQTDGHSAIQYKPELYYVVICYTPSHPKVLEYANFLAQRGEDVAIEIAQQGNEQLYALVGAKGFTTAETARQHRNDLVRLGDTLQRGVWKEANVYKDIKGH